MSAKKKSFSEEFSTVPSGTEYPAAKKPSELMRDGADEVKLDAVDPPSPTAFPHEFEAHGTYTLGNYGSTGIFMMALYLVPCFRIFALSGTKPACFSASVSHLFCARSLALSPFISFHYHC